MRHPFYIIVPLDVVYRYTFLSEKQKMSLATLRIYGPHAQFNLSRARVHSFLQ